jgi:hypothetical protein
VPAHPEIVTLFGWNKGVPNFADASSTSSKAIAGGILEQLQVTQPVEHVGQTAGILLEQAVESILAASLPTAMGLRRIRVERLRPITEFRQYSHLTQLDAVLKNHPDPLVRVTLGGDYLIVPDVVVELFDETAVEPGFLHAAVPCKWTLRSDRAQNVRHEAVTMIRNRRGRVPHIVPVTAEPMPTRLASLARGTGEVDVLYHVALDELLRVMSPEMRALRPKPTGARPATLGGSAGRLRDQGAVPAVLPPPGAFGPPGSRDRAG